MKTLTKFTAAALLAIAASAPAFADNMQQVRASHAMSQAQTDGTHAQASAPLTQTVNDPAANAFNY